VVELGKVCRLAEMGDPGEQTGLDEMGWPDEMGGLG
jgi:hypothetical protein